jgi:RNA-directed DNA polymerase
VADHREEPTAAEAADLRGDAGRGPKKVRNLQKLMLRSRANALVSVRRVTEINTGRKTAGVDGTLVVSAQGKADMASWVQHAARPWSPQPVKRVYVPKKDGRRRPLGIPVVADRCLQAMADNALEPEWEARFEARSYGFRPGRGCHDAIRAIHEVGKGRNAKRLWVLDADLEAAFDRLSHDHIYASLGYFPARGLIWRWLTAGVVERGEFTPTVGGTPQGGVISPLLLNVALHGMETAAGVRYLRLGADAAHVAAGSPVVIRYADDLLALCHTRDQAEQVKARLAEWLAPRGLVFNETKTRITHLDQGVDFLGFNIRRYRGKLLTKPSIDALRRIRSRLTAEMRSLRGANVDAVIARLNPIIAGWAAYYRIGVSSQAFQGLDHHVWRLTYKWGRLTHPNKSKHWVVNRYFGEFNPHRRDRWILGSRESGFYLRKFAWTKIVRHQLVNGTVSPDDPSLTEYWSQRRRRRPPPLPRSDLRLLETQHGRCPVCRGLLLHADTEPQSPHEWEQWFTVTRKAVRRQAMLTAVVDTPDDHAAVRLIHTYCRRRLHGDGTTSKKSARL